MANVDASDCVVTCGSSSSTSCPTDEADILVDSFGLSPSRESKFTTNSDGCVIGVELFNPLLVITIEGAPLTEVNLNNAPIGCADYYGTTLTTLANIEAYSAGGADVWGHDLSLGCLMLTDAEFSCSKDDDTPTVSVELTHYQHAV